MKKGVRGFFIVEVLVVLVIMAVLTLLFLPNLQSYLDRAKYADVIRQASMLQPAVEICIVQLFTATGCNSGTNGIPTAVSTGISTSHVQGSTVTNGVITVTSTSGLGAGASYILSPSYSNGVVTWVRSGTCSANALC